MPTADIIVICAITAAFLVFAIALAWGDRQTREIARASRQRALTGGHIASLKRSVQPEAVERKGSASPETSPRTPARV